MWIVPAAMLLAVAAPEAQDSLVVETLARHRYPLEVRNGRLGGAGGEWLVREGATARFVAVGEEHGIAQIPGLVAAWFTALAPRGFGHLAVEVGPMTGRLLDSLAGHGTDALREFQRAHPPGFPFFILREEADLLVAARAALPRRADVVWGIDYDILGDRYLLEQLADAAPQGPARDTVGAIRALSDSGVARALREGNPGHALLFSAGDEPFERLRTALQPAAGSYADHAIATMQETAAINRLFVTGRNWESNRRRADMNKRWFLRHYRAALAAGDAAPRVLIKLGANHLFRGLNRTRQYDVGTLLAQLAEVEGGTSFHLLIVGGPGGRRAQFQPQRSSMPRCRRRSFRATRSPTSCSPTGGRCSTCVRCVP